MKIRKALLYMAMVCVLTGCNKEEETAKTDVTTIANINNIQFQIPSSLREGAQSYNEFVANKVTVTNDFQYGTVETATTHTYTLTNYESFYLYCTDAYPFQTNLAYITNIDTMEDEIEDSFADMSLSNFQYSHEGNVSQIMANISFTPIFSDETNTRRIENASGTIVLYGIDEKQYLFVYVENKDILPEDDYHNMFQSFTYTEETSSLYSDKNRTVKEYEGSNCGINISYNEMATIKEETIIIPSYNEAKITTKIYNSETDHELTSDELIAQMTQEEMQSRTILWKDTEISSDTDMVWQGRTFQVVNMEDQQYNQCIYMANIGKTIITISAQYVENDNTRIRHDVNSCVKDLIRNATLTSYTALDGSVVELIQEPTTEVTTEATTEATTKTTTQATTQGTTEASPEVTTEVTTQATTQATTQTTKKTQQSTTEKTTTKKKKNNNSDLDVEW